MEPLYHPIQGQPSHPPLMMFKALLLQQWHGLSDPGLEEAICDRLSFQRFLSLSLTDPVPDETRICRFRNMLRLLRKAIGRGGQGPRAPAPSLKIIMR